MPRAPVEINGSVRSRLPDPTIYIISFVPPRDGYVCMCVCLILSSPITNLTPTTQLKRAVLKLTWIADARGASVLTELRAALRFGLLHLNALNTFPIRFSCHVAWLHPGFPQGYFGVYLGTSSNFGLTDVLETCLGSIKALGSKMETRRPNSGWNRSG